MVVKGRFSFYLVIGIKDVFYYNSIEVRLMEVGYVRELKGSHVVVIMQRHEACKKCGACSHGHQEQEMYIEAANSCEAKLGDWVKIELSPTHFLKAVTILYGIPLIALLIGIGVGYWIGDNTNQELFAILFGILFLTITYYSIRKNEHRWNTERFRPVAVEVVEHP